MGAGRGRLQGHERQHCVFPCASRAFSDVTGPTQALSDGREKNVCCEVAEKDETAARLTLSFATSQCQIPNKHGEGRENCYDMSIQVLLNRIAIFWNNL